MSRTSLCRIGSANASVLPEPVCAPPMTSRPSRMPGMHAAWMGVGTVMASMRSARTSAAEMPSAANDGAAGAAPASVVIAQTAAVPQKKKKKWSLTFVRRYHVDLGALCCCVRWCGSRQGLLLYLSPYSCAVIPMGTPTTSVGEYIAECQRVCESMEAEGLRHQVREAVTHLSSSMFASSRQWLWYEFGGPYFGRVARAAAVP